MRTKIETTKMNPKHNSICSLSKILVVCDFCKNKIEYLLCIGVMLQKFSLRLAHLVLYRVLGID
jgi:hypothetical protein